MTTVACLLAGSTAAFAVGFAVESIHRRILQRRFAALSEHAIALNCAVRELAAEKWGREAVDAACANACRKDAN